MVMLLNRLACFALIIFLAGCRFTYLVREDGQQLNRNFRSDCGNGVFTMRGRGKHSFSLHQSFFNVKEIQLDFSGLEVTFEGKSLPLQIINERTGRGFSKNTLLIKEDIEISANFRVEEGVFRGDTIKVFINAYLRCKNGSNINMDPMIFHFSGPIEQTDQ